MAAAPVAATLVGMAGTLGVVITSRYFNVPVTRMMLGWSLDAIPDEHPPPAEKPPRPTRERKPKSPPPKGGGSVPRVPLKV